VTVLACINLRLTHSSACTRRHYELRSSYSNTVTSKLVRQRATLPAWVLACIDSPRSSRTPAQRYPMLVISPRWHPLHPPLTVPFPCALQAQYCSAECQRAHWKRGGHKAFCDGMKAACAFISAAEQRAAAAAASSAEQGGSCIICLESDPPPIQSGCACRGDAGLAHVACRILVADHAQQSSGKLEWGTYISCGTCKQTFGGAMGLGMACALWRRAQRLPETHHERRVAAASLGNVFSLNRMGAEAESILRYLLAVATRNPGRGVDSENVLAASADLATALACQGKNAEAEPILRRCHAQIVCLHGPDSVATIMAAFSLGGCLANQSKHDEALPIFQTCLAAWKRTEGSESSLALLCASAMADTLVALQRFDEAEPVYSEILPIMKRVLGPDHCVTLQTVERIAMSGLHADA
jgi:hypothetical protein